MSHSGKMLFVGTSSGAIRSVKFPLAEPGEWQEHLVHSSSVTKVRIIKTYMYMYMYCYYCTCITANIYCTCTVHVQYMYCTRVYC